MRGRIVLIGLLGVLLVPGAEIGGRVEYVGGTVGSMEQRASGRLVVSDEVTLLLRLDKQELRVPFEKVNLLEYGQKASRRIGMAVLVSPMFLLTKKRAHFLTVGYEDPAGRQQAMVFRVEKDDIRSVLVALEARTGLKVQYQDEEARKAGKG
ncbi:MAG TPA: hypothetical protein DEH78_23665 [Solibacterales bacterium]|nr:hypothetical protein [Bryobacterales bacterium]